MTETDGIGLAERVVEVNRRLVAGYGHHKPVARLHPTDELLLTILSQHTADRNSHRAFEQLKRTYSSWELLRTAPEQQLADTIRTAGLANIKAHRIKQVLNELHARFGTVDLDFLRTLSLDEARQILIDLPGVGPKTAACVLLFSLGQSAFPVDTHVHRVTRRLGLVGPKDSAERTHEVLEAAIPAQDIYDFHVNLVRHGREVCRAQHPRCGVCVLQDICTYYQKQLTEQYDCW
jgi:endonuclease-3